MNPTSQKHSQTFTARQDHGFTLIEFLVVLFIVGLISASIVVMAFPDERDILRQEASRLGLLLEQARDQAFINGRSIAWSAQDDGYTFWQLNAQRQWEPFAGDQVLRARKLPSSMAVSALLINQVKAARGERLIFSPTGLNPAFDAILTLHEQQLRLSSDSLGQIQIHAQ